MRFTHDFLRLQAEKLENIRVANGKTIQGFSPTAPGQLGQRCFVMGKAGALEVERSDLPFQFAYGPVAPQAYGFVKGALEGAFEGNQLLNMSVGKLLQEPSRDMILCGRRPHFFQSGANTLR